VTYLEVATAETIALQAQLSRVNILNRYMNASVLVKALGGGWRIDTLGRSAHGLDNPNIINGF
jgi:outer membrane protein TolC